MGEVTPPTPSLRLNACGRSAELRRTAESLGVAPVRLEELIRLSWSLLSSTSPTSAPSLVTDALATRAALSALGRPSSVIRTQTRRQHPNTALLPWRDVISIDCRCLVHRLSYSKYRRSDALENADICPPRVDGVSPKHRLWLLGALPQTRRSPQGIARRRTIVRMSAEHGAAALDEQPMEDLIQLLAGDVGIELTPRCTDTCVFPEEQTLQAPSITCHGSPCWW